MFGMLFQAIFVKENIFILVNFNIKSRSEHKFFPPTGMASFWTHLPKSLEILDDVTDVKENFDNINEPKYKENTQKQRCVCSQVLFINIP